VYLDDQVLIIKSYSYIVKWPKQGENWWLYSIIYNLYTI